MRRSSIDPDAPQFDLGLPPIVRLPELSWPDVRPTRQFTAALPTTELSGLRSALFVQAFVHEAADTTRLVQHTGVGVVYTLAHKSYRRPMLEALAAVDYTRRRTLTNDLLVDRNQYSGKNRKRASDGLSVQWIRDQHNVMKLAWALTDSGFHTSLGDVKFTLDKAAHLGDRVIVALPMSHRVLSDDPDALVKLINAQDHPVAIMLEHEGDPFDEPPVAPALSNVIRHSRPSVLHLRSDTSALGAISHGAQIGAVGNHSELRHIYPVSGGGGGLEALAYVIPELLGFYHESRFARAYFQDPSLLAWTCPCWFCGSRDLTWIANQPQPIVFRAGFQHSVAAVAGLGSALAGPRSLAPLTWDAMCSQAQLSHSQVPNPSGSAWDPRPALAHWRQATPQSITAI